MKLSGSRFVLKVLVISAVAAVATPPIPEASAARPSLNALNTRLNQLEALVNAQQAEIDELRRSSLRVVDALGSVVGIAPGGNINSIYLEAVGILASIASGDLEPQHNAHFADPLCEGPAYVFPNDANHLAVETVNGVKRFFVPRREPSVSVNVEAVLDSTGCEPFGVGLRDMVRADEVPVEALGLSLPYTPPFHWELISE